MNKSILLLAAMMSSVWKVLTRKKKWALIMLSVFLVLCVVGQIGDYLANGRGTSAATYSYAATYSDPEPWPQPDPNPERELLQLDVDGEWVFIPRDRIPFHGQEKQNWCWAACIQMVCSAKGIAISQEEIVTEVYGSPINKGGLTSDTMARLRKWRISRSGTQSLEPSVVIGIPQLSLLTVSLKNNTPVYLAYRNPGHDSWHAVVVIGVEILSSPQGRELNNVYVYDPGFGPRYLSGAEWRNTTSYIIVDSN